MSATELLRNLKRDWFVVLKWYAVGMESARSWLCNWTGRLGLVWLLFAVGCAAGPSGEVRLLLEPPYVDVGGGGVVRALDLLPLSERAGEVLVTDTGVEHDAVDRVEAIAPPDELVERGEVPGEVLGEVAGLPSGVWRMSVGGWWVVDVMADTRGAVVILSEVEEAEARRIEYDPPLPMIPAELWMGRPVEFGSDVKLYNSESGALEATGKVRATYRLLGKKVISPGGLLPGDAPEEAVYIVEVDRKYNLPLVAIDMNILSAYELGEGPVAGKTVRVVKLLGLLPVVHVQSVQRR